MKLFASAAAIAVTCAATSLGAVTVDPTNFDRIYTEDGRTQTVSGSAITGNAAVTGNVDVDRFRVADISEGQSYLLSGRALDDDRDRWVFRNVTGILDIDILAITRSTGAPRGGFNTRFNVVVDGTRVEQQRMVGALGEELNASFLPITVNDAQVVIVARDRGGASDYDLSVSLTAVPVPGAVLLMLTGLAGLSAASRKKRKS